MYVESGNGGGGGGGHLPERRGTRFAPELDRRLAGNEPLSAVLNWWDDEWRAAMRVQVEFSSSMKDPGIKALRPENFSDNEWLAFTFSALNSCYCGADPSEYSESYWPMLGIDARS
jgi:hypothetical protein